MTKIFIKKDKLKQKTLKDSTIDLRDNLDVKQKKSFKKWFFLSIFILIIIVLAFNWWLLSSQKIPFKDLVPENRVVFSLVNQEALYNQTSPYTQPAMDKINNYFKQVDLSFKDNVQSAFKQEAGFILMPANDETSFPFFLAFERKASFGDIKSVLDKIEVNLKKDYNFSQEKYRQIEVTLLDPIYSTDNLPNLYAFAQVEDYFIITNSKELLKEIINLIID
ncbi:hypothetical protein KKE74_00565 [Patescibacteria group bacterium]|nr:hypothetical protein [Patescibacteria group bacterium]